MVFEWPSLRPDRYPIKMMWNDLKRAINTRHAATVSELKWFWREEWSERLVHCLGGQSYIPSVDLNQLFSAAKCENI